MPTATDRNGTTASAYSFTSRERQHLRRRLLAWYSEHARDLPWRSSRDPYRVWISEVMLQQTQVATVRDYFQRFVAAFPNVESLAAADEEQVLKLWEGLGYYRRARQLHLAARQIVDDFGGNFPRTAPLLQALPGIGRYTAGAIASIAFGERAPILEANTIRLLSRLIAYRDDPLNSAAQRILWKTAEEILPQRDVAAFNQALMELGSLVCTPREPKCAACPLSEVCRARSGGLEREIPLPKAPKTYTEVREAAVIVRKGGRFLLRRCAAKERWAGLWDFPRFPIESRGPLFAREEIISSVRERTGITCAPEGLLKTLKHGVTRFRITLDCYQASFASGRISSSGGATLRWVAGRELEDYPLSVTGRRIARLITSPD